MTQNATEILQVSDLIKFLSDFHPEAPVDIEARDGSSISEVVFATKTGTELRPVATIRTEQAFDELLRELTE